MKNHQKIPEEAQKACQLQPQDPTWPLALADLYLRDATPRYDKPAGNPTAAKRALACLHTAWPVMSESMRNSYRPNVRERLALAAFWAGEYDQARKKGERTAVIEFLDACAAFWKGDGGSLAQWKKTIQAGETPDFGPGFKFRFNKPKL
jgi:hypothetical protein